MINIENGEITLCKSQFVLKPNVDIETAKAALCDLIIRQWDSSTGFDYLNCWCDIEADQYIYVVLGFHFGRLFRIDIHPQHRGVPSQGEPLCMELDRAQKEVKEWYGRLFIKERQDFSWGRTMLIEGNDPIYHPPEVRIEFVC